MPSNENSGNQTVPEKKKPFAALQYRDYSLIFFGQGISQVGTFMRVTAISWQVYSLTHDALLLGLIGLFRVVPLIVFSLIGGAFADAVDRRKLLLLAYSILMVSSTALAIITITGAVNVWWIYAITIASGAVNAFERPAFAALVPALIPRHQLANALSLNTMNFQIALVIGPGLAGLIIAGFDVQGVYLIDAVSYTAIIISMFFIHYRPSGPSLNRVSMQAAIEGIRFVMSKKILVSTMLLDFVATFFGSARTMLPIISTEVLKTDELGFGILSAAESAGALLASFVLAWFNMGRVRNPGIRVVWAVLSYSLFTVFFGFSTWLPLSVILLALVGASDTVSMVLRQTISQLITPDNMRGRMQSVNMVFFMGGPQLGEVEAGIVARMAGAQFSVISGGIACVMVVGAIGYWSRSLRHYQFDREHTREVAKA